MKEQEYSGLAALAAMRTKLDSASHLEVIHEGGYCWKAHFEFGNPATADSIEKVRSQLDVPFPTVYDQFLRHYDGALLYHDDTYGQWGFQLYGTKDLIEKNMLWQSLYDGWSASYLVFAESRGDSDLLLFDTSQQTKKPGECVVLDGDTGYPAASWRIITLSFSDWLDRLVVAQGAKYWRWY
jgi:hypothetical protein